MTVSRETRYVVYERFEDSVSFSVEVVEAGGRDPSAHEATAPERADARLVRLSGGEAPASIDLPRSLRVESGPLGVAKAREAYATTSDGAPTSDVESISMHHIAEIGRSLWPGSPYYRGPRRRWTSTCWPALLRWRTRSPRQRIARDESRRSHGSARASRAVRRARHGPW